MGKKAFIGASSKAHQVKKIYFGVSGKARKVKKGFIGVSGKAHQFFSSGAEKGLYWLFKDGATTVTKLDPITAAIQTTVTMITDGTFGVSHNYGWGSAEAFGSLTNYGINSGSGVTASYNLAVQKTDPQSGAMISRLINFTASGSDSVGANNTEIVIRYALRYASTTTKAGNYLTVYDPITGGLIRTLIDSRQTFTHDIVCGSTTAKYINIFDEGSNGDDNKATENQTSTNAVIRTIYDSTSYSDDYDVLDNTIFKMYQLAGGVWDNKMHLWKLDYLTLSVTAKFELPDTGRVSSICTVKG